MVTFEFIPEKRDQELPKKIQFYITYIHFVRAKRCDYLGKCDYFEWEQYTLQKLKKLFPNTYVESETMSTTYVDYS